MSALPSARPVSLEEFELLPHKDGIQELLDGEVIEMPPPKLRHSKIIQTIEGVLLRHIHRSRVWVETGFVIGRNCVQPDVAVCHSDQGKERGWYAGAPLIAIEVASRGNTPDELEFKKDLYLANGAQEVWILFDKTKTVARYRLGGATETHRDVFQTDMLAADPVSIDIAELFGGS